MLQLQEQYITNAQGDRIAVILDITAYQKLLDEMDEFFCWKDYQQALKETDPEIANGDFVTLDHYLAKVTHLTQSEDLPSSPNPFSRRRREARLLLFSCSPLLRERG